jgi:hypothetical protein
MSTRIARLCGVTLCVAAVLVASLPTASGAAGSKQLRRVKGNVGYQPASVAAVTPLFGKIDLPDDSTAITEANSVAELALPDSSIVTIGAGTRVKIGAFNETADGPGSSIIVDGGTLRFDIKRPAGGRANYQFQTPTSQIAVRGTIGLLSVINGVTTVGCVQCAADSVVVTTGGQTFALATGQILTVTATGVAVPGALTPAASAGFGASGVSTGAGGAGAAGAGGAIGAAAGAAAVGGIVAASISRPTSGPQTAAPTVNPTFTPSPSPTPTPSPLPTKMPPVPTPSPSATATIPGSVTIQGRRVLPAAAATTAPGPVNVPGEMPGLPRGRR